MAQTRSRRCSICHIDWPNLDDCRTCPICHADTWKNSDAPNRTITQAREAIRTGSSPDNTETQELPVPSPAYSHRLDRYLELGFSAVDAHQLACARDVKGFFVYHGVVGRCLDQGATHEQAVRVFA